MSLWSRMSNVFRRERLNREIDEEIQSHIDEAIECGRDPAEVRRAFDSAIRTRQGSRDIKLAAWVDSLRDDLVFGWRQIRQNKTTSVAAILSLGLSIGACTAAFASSMRFCSGHSRCRTPGAYISSRANSGLVMASAIPATASLIRVSACSAPL